MLVYPDGTRRELAFYINWSDQPGYVAMQMASWLGIPQDAAQLWKPDKIEFSVNSKRTDKRGFVIFESPVGGQISEPARAMAKSLRPQFSSTWISVDDGYLVSRLWAGWPWQAKLRDRNGAALGVQAILLPGPETAQAMFARLKIELDGYVADKATKCSANPEPEGIEEII